MTCSYPVVVRVPRRSGRSVPVRRPCGKRALWRVNCWEEVKVGRWEDGKDREVLMWSALRCADHRAHDVQERMLADRVTEVRL